MRKKTVLGIILIPLLTGTLAEASIVFSEDFESGSQNWNLEEGWHLERIDNNNVLLGIGHVWARLTYGSWDNYALRAKFKIVHGTIHFNFRHTELDGSQNRYFIGISSTNLYLNKQIEVEFYDLTGIFLSPQLGDGWHEIEIRGYGNILNIYLDNTLLLVYKDDNNPILSGTIAFETLEESEVLIDEVEIDRSDTELSGPIREIFAGLLLGIIIVFLIRRYYRSKSRIH